jgi:hypothetical protein
VDHPFPSGTAGMVCLLGAVALLERGRRVEEATPARNP